MGPGLGGAGSRVCHPTGACTVILCLVFSPVAKKRIADLPLGQIQESSKSQRSLSKASTTSIPIHPLLAGEEAY